jgi:feruloyl esterase
MKIVAVAVVVVLWSTAGYAQGPPLDAAACARLAASLRLPHANVTSAQAVAAGQFVPPDGNAALKDAAARLPAFCRVSMTITPTPDSDIKSEVWLPLAGWNGKFQHVGNGGWGGSIQYAALADALRRGYAAASTDTGHVGDTASFALGHPEKLVDFGYRAVHETTVHGKSTIEALYGSAPRLSYFVGCSGGGRQGFMEVQRYPADFDGVIAGAPGYNRTDQSFQLVAASQATHADTASYIPPAKFAVLHAAALKACDATDGLADGLIGDPMRCRFDPQVAACRGGDAPDCLTTAQVAAARKLYAPVTDPRTGKEVFPGVEPGSEPRWTVNAGGAKPLGMADELFKFVVFQDPAWDFHTLDVSKHLEVARKADGGTVSATSANIQPFVERDGKLIIYHGWGDTNVPPRSSVNYYDQLIATLGVPRVERSVRLYMVPAMGHCGGGEGPNTFDMVTALEQWREQGKPPLAVVASKVTDGKVERTRPLCPFPQIARYDGAGSIDDGSNFVCRQP